ncbi:branched-chain amino acid ABC transporter permease/ATP-binding protein [Pseudonocardia xishanensis]|uniref:Branched-chain amino acid ABC transporter permease/ATP-binding protein n=1 Tax=Pseudonocardia xishanensis TaxID=630995 RepID=A0ABP8RP56_9PSEU
MTNFLAILIQALGPGAMLGLLALGLVLVYRSTGVLNLAHGAQAALGGYIYWDLSSNAGLPGLLALLIAVLASGVVGVLIQVLVMRPLRGAAPLTLLIGSIGVLIVIQTGLLLRYGSTPRSAQSVLPNGLIEIFDGQSVGIDRLLLLVIGIVVAAGLWALYSFSLFGSTTSAVAENPVAAATLGHASDRIAVGNWFLGGALAGLAGGLLAPISGLDLVTMNGLIVPALGAALAGGLISFPLTIVGALIIQIAQSISTSYIDFRGVGAASTFVIVVAMLLLRGESIPDRGYVGSRMPTLGTGVLSWRWMTFWAVVAGAIIWVLRPAAWTDAILTSMLIAIVMLSIVVITGYAGQVSLAQFGLAGCGAVFATELTSRADVPFLLVLLIAAVCTVPIGVVLALGAMRMRGASLAVITLAFNVVLFATAFSDGDVKSIPSPTIFGVDFGSLVYPERYLSLVIVVFILLGIAVANLRRSSTGRRLVAVRGNERAAAAIGIRVGRTKAIAFGVASAIAAVGGVLFAFRSPAVTYTSFGSLASIDQLAWTVVGGLGYVAGPLIGMVFATGGVGTQLADVVYDDQFTWLPMIGGLALIVTMVANQDGLSSVIAGQVAHVRALLSRVLPFLRERPAAAAGGAARVRRTAPTPVTGAPAPSRRREGVSSLRLEDVSVSFGGVKAMQHVSLEVTPGTVHGLIGPNGAGKSTLLDVVSGFVPSHTGTVHLGDRRIDRMPVWKRAHEGIGRSFQSLELFPDLTVRDNLRVAAEAGRSDNVLRDLVFPRRTELNVAALDAVRFLQLEDELDQRIDSLSYGRRRIVAIARTLASDADVIMLDEPASGLDEVERQELSAAVRAMADVHGRAVLLIEHDVDLVMATSDVVTALDFGTVIASGAPAHVRSHPEVIASYLGAVSDEEAVIAVTHKTQEV